jgi:hypothetical protein
VRIGATAKVFNSRLAEYSARGFAVDLGGQSDLTDRMTVGASLLNMGAQSAYDQVSDPLPSDFSLSGRYRLMETVQEDIELAAQMDRPLVSDDPITLGVGAEYTFVHTLVLRAGWKFGAETGPLSVGAGFLWQGLSLDYAYNTLGDLGMTNRFTLNLQLGTLFRRLGWTQAPEQGSGTP